MTYGLYLGCIAPMRYPGIERTTRAVMDILGMDYVDMEGECCCPAPGVTRSFDQHTWLALAARNLSIAEQKGAELLTICNGCFGSLFEAAEMLEEDPKLKKEINDILASADRHYDGPVKVRHIVEVLYRDIGLDAVSKKVTEKLNIKVAVHYGCHFLKPSKHRKIDDPERPTILDELVEVTGAKSVPYADKQACCGAGGGVRSGSPEVALKMTDAKLHEVEQAHVDCIVTPCPFCHLQFDRGQKELGYKYKIPVLHISQLLAVAFGVEKDQLGFDEHAVPVEIKWA